MTFLGGMLLGAALAVVIIGVVFFGLFAEGMKH
jgi:hypothetical protein